MQGGGAECRAGHGEGALPVRARELPGMNALVTRVKKVADGAALMSETR